MCYNAAMHASQQNLSPTPPTPPTPPSLSGSSLNLHVSGNNGNSAFPLSPGIVTVINNNSHNGNTDVSSAITTNNGSTTITLHHHTHHHHHIHSPLFPPMPNLLHQQLHQQVG